MTPKQRKKYLINRCYSAHYAKLPDMFKEVNALRYPGLWISILSNTELFNIQNLTPDCTDVLLNTKGGYSADYENLEYTLQVFYELNYYMHKMRFIGVDVLNYPEFEKVIKLTLRLPKIKYIEVICSGDTVPTEAQCDVLRNPGMRAVVESTGSKLDEIEALFNEKEVNYSVREPENNCTYCENTHTIFVEGKIFRCPLSAVDYANGKEVEEKCYCDMVARKLEIKELRLAIFDITNDPPPADCANCSKQISK